MSEHVTPSATPNGSAPEKVWFLGDLTRRVLGWMLVVSLLPLLVMAYQGYHCAGQALVEQTQQHLDSVLSARTRLVEEWLIARSREMRLLGGGIASGTGADDRSRLLEAARMGDPGYVWVAVFDEAGRPLAVAPPDAAPEPLSAEARDDAARGREVTVQGEERGDRFIRLVHPLVGAEDGARWLAARIDVSRSFDALLRDQSGLGRSGRIYAASKDLTILSDPFGGAEGTPADPEVRHAAAGHVRHGHGFFHLLPVSPRILRSAAAVPGTGWLLVAEADPDEALAWLGTLRRRAIATGTITLVLLVGVAYGIARALGRPLRELARVASHVRGGRTEERLGPMRGAEAEAVRRAFNRMLDDLREKQRELVRSATLASVGELSSSIVHEMRNPLSSIKMNLQALRPLAESDPGYRELADIAWDQLGRVECMLDDLLKYGRPVELHDEPITFRELADSALPVVADAARVKGVRIDVDDGLDGHRFEVDREQMTRALTNLLLNAVQAAPPGGEVRFSAHPHAEDGRVVIEVADSGPGLAREAADRLFRPFFTTKPDGTGLGLANVKKIVELHDGTVSAGNRPGGGAVFAVTLPVGTDPEL